MMTVMSVPQGGSRRHGAPVTVPGARAAAVGADPEVEAGDPLAILHRAHYTSLVRLATLVVGDIGTAEQVTQDAFVKLQLRWGGLRDPAKAPAYLRSAVLNGARSQLRRRRVGVRHDARRTAAPAAVTPESATVGRAEHERVVAALRRLPRRQREAVTLKYYLDLPEAEIAAAMGVSGGSVKTHLHRGLAALAQDLGEDRP
jgi:RNA polymerase sigma-70 factor (sigma-E family)